MITYYRFLITLLLTHLASTTSAVSFVTGPCHAPYQELEFERVALRGDVSFVAVHEQPDGYKVTAGYFLILKTKFFAGIYSRYDAYGVVLSEEAYDPNAGQLVQVDPTSGLGYRGQSYDAETGLVYLRNRYYEPEYGCFTQVDPARAGNDWFGYAGGDPVDRLDPTGLEWILNSPHAGLAYATEDTDTIQGLAEKLVREGLQQGTEGAIASLVNLNPNPVNAFVNDGAEAVNPFVDTGVGVGAGYTVDIDADSGFQIAGVGDHVFTTLINESVLLRRSTASLRTEYATVLADLQAAINARQELEEGSDAYAEANRRVRSLSVDWRRLKSRFGEFSEGYIARVKGSLQVIPDSAPQWLRYFTVGLQGLDSLSISNTIGAHGTSSSRGVTIAESTFASDNRSMSLLSTIIHESLHQYYDTLESEQPAELRAAIEAYKNRTITDEQRDLMRYYGNLEHTVIYADEASAGLLLFGDVPDRMKERLREFDDGRYEFVRPSPDRYLEMVLRHKGVEYDDSGLRSLPSTYDLGGVYGVVNIPELPYIPFEEE